MCVAVRRNNYPIDCMQMLPGHTITIMAPVTLANLLPYEITYEAGVEGGRIAPGCNADLHCVDSNEQLEITIQLDGYSGSGMVCVSNNHMVLSRILYEYNLSHDLITDIDICIRLLQNKWPMRNGKFRASYLRSE